MPRTPYTHIAVVLAALLLLAQLVPTARGQASTASVFTWSRVHQLIHQGRASGAAPTIALSTDTASAGDVLALEGQGYRPQQSVTILLVPTRDTADPIVLATVVADGAGAFGIDSLPIPAVDPGTYLVAALSLTDSYVASASLRVVAAPAAGGSPTAMATDTSATSATATSTPPGGSATPTVASATPPDASATATGEQASSTPTADVPTDSPTDAVSAGPSDTATAGPTKAAGSASVGAPASLTVAPTRITAGESIGLVASNLPPGAGLDIQLAAGDGSGAAIDLGTATADAAGGLSQHSIMVPPDVAEGSYQVLLIGADSSVLVQTPLYVSGRHASISVTPATFSPGDGVTMSGSGFLPGETVQVALSAPGGGIAVSLGQFPADAAGGFYATGVAVPYGAPTGQVLVLATGQRSNLQAAILATATVRAPSLTLGATTLAPGDPLTVGGTNFQPQEPIAVDLVTLTGTIPLGTARCDDAGSFSLARLTVPADAPAGSLNIVATGALSHLSAVAGLIVKAPPAEIVASPATLQPGDALHLAAQGFIPGETLSVQLGGGSLDAFSLATAAADHAGRLPALPLILPGVLPAGTYTLILSGLLSGRVATASLQVHAPHVVAPLLGIVLPSAAAHQAYQANPGAMVQMAGSNFPPGASVTLQLAGGTAGAQTQASVVSDAIGARRVAGRSPDGVARGLERGSPAVASGTRLGASALTTLATVQANDRGSLGPFGVALPASLPAGTYSIEASAAGRVVASTTLRLQPLRPQLALSVGTLRAGQDVTVRGSHFAAGEQVVLALNSRILSTRPAAVLTNTGGDFMVRFTAPDALVATGNTLTATGTRSRSVAASNLHAEIPAATYWYFADGDTAKGQRSSISVINANAVPVRVRMTFLYQVARERRYTTVIPAHAHASIDLALAAGPSRYFSTILEADRAVGAESIVSYGNHVVATALGANAPASQWYLAEGFTGHTFREYLEIMNPNSTAATADVRLLPFNGRPPKDIRLVLRPRTTLVVDARAYMPLASISAVVTADKGIVVERTMRFGRDSLAADETIGSTSASPQWLFAQSSSAPTRQTFLTVLNISGATQALVTASFFDRHGTALGTTTIFVDPLHRGNVKLNDVLARAEAAVVITSNVPVVVERSAYSSPTDLDLARSGSVLLGYNSGSNRWIFPDIQTGLADQARLYLFNPSLTSVAVSVRFYTDSGAAIVRRLTLAADTFTVLDLASVPGLPAGTVSALLTANGGQVFVAEQATYNSDFDRLSTSAGIP